MSELILYRTEDGHAEVRLRAEGGSAWLTQSDIAELFATTPQNNITQHIKGHPGRRRIKRRSNL